jgi:hypothetical protein
MLNRLSAANLPGRHCASCLWTAFLALVKHYTVLHHNSLSALNYIQESPEWVPPPPKARADRPGESTQTKQTAPYAKWPLAASTFRKTNHCLITLDATEKDKNIWKLSGPDPLTDGRDSLIYTDLLLSRRYWFYQLRAEFPVEESGSWKTKNL